MSPSSLGGRALTSGSDDSSGLANGATAWENLWGTRGSSAAPGGGGAGIASVGLHSSGGYIVAQQQVGAAWPAHLTSLMLLCMSAYHLKASMSHSLLVLRLWVPVRHLCATVR